MNPTWRFSCGAGRGWSWHKHGESGDLEAWSRATFDTCEAAIADAQSHGYSYVPPRNRIGRSRGKTTEKG